MISQFLEELPEEIQQILQQLEAVHKRLEIQQGFSKEDIKSLRQLLFHLDALINKIKNRSKKQESIAFQELLNYFQDSAGSLRRIILEQENSDYLHLANHQRENDATFMKLITQLESLKEL